MRAEVYTARASQRTARSTRGVKASTGGWDMATTTIRWFLLKLPRLVRYWGLVVGILNVVAVVTFFIQYLVQCLLLLFIFHDLRKFYFS